MPPVRRQARVGTPWHGGPWEYRTRRDWSSGGLLAGRIVSGRLGTIPPRRLPAGTGLLPLPGAGQQ